MDAPFRCGDHVLVRFSSLATGSLEHDGADETLVVAFVDDDRMWWSGWPEGCVELERCALVKRATDAEHASAVGQWLDGKSDHEAMSDIRRRNIIRLYRPAEYRRILRENRRRRMADIENELTRLRAEEAAEEKELICPPTQTNTPA